MIRHTIFVTLITILTGTSMLAAADWPGFRGPGVSGSSEETGLPLAWSETENLAWKTPLPGPGSSSPIVMGDKVFVTCYSGYGLDKDNPSDPNQLKRHLVCLSVADGTVLWDKAVPAVLPETLFKGQIQQHGYASSTPISDGERVYVFFGKSGVFAFDMQGTQVWQRSVGTDSDKMKWGSASSPILYRNLVIVNAWDESKTLYALNKNTGEPVWQKDLSETALTFATPILAKAGNGRTELILSLPTQVWGLNPATGDRLWFVRTTMKDTVIGTPVVDGDVVCVQGGGPNSRSSMAIRLGGDGDVTDTHVIWSGKEGLSVPSPVVVDGRAYSATDMGQAACQDLSTGDFVYNQDLPAAGQFAVYASVVQADGRIYATTRKGGVFVLPAQPTFEILAHNTFASDNSDFNGSPAISNGRIFLRSKQALYCVASKN